MKFQEELRRLFSANIPVIYLVGREEERVAATVAGLDPNLFVACFDVARGLYLYRGNDSNLVNINLNSDTVLPYLERSMPSGCVVLLKDFHIALNGQRRGLIIRQIKNMVDSLRAKAQYLVITAPVQALPVELHDHVTVLELPLPDRDELEDLLNSMTSSLPTYRRPSGETKKQVIEAALGLTLNQARNAFSMVWATHGRFDQRAVGLVLERKREIVHTSGALSFWPVEDIEKASVGGLDLLKKWIARRRRSFSSDAEKAGLPYPKGMALVGIPGTGKSLTARMVAAEWNMPLLRLDVGALFTSLLGESEENIRQALELAETVSPCVLWIDEVEKAFAGTSASSLNSGAAARVFGTFLTWMQECRKPVFMFVTANDISSLPSELVARFDRTFFLDLPNDEERIEIFSIHLAAAGINMEDVDLSELGMRSAGLVGREIERVVREARFSAFAEDRRVQQADLLEAMDEIVPVSVSHAEQVDLLQKWKEQGRAYPASSDAGPQHKADIIRLKVAGG